MADRLIPLPPPFAALLLLLLLLPGCSSEATSQPTESTDTQPATQRVEIEGRVFELELALDERARYRGLSDRPTIAADGGMLFVFPYPRELTFVMRRCLVPIDLIFLDPGGRVVSMHEMAVEPYETPEGELRPYSSRWPAQFAIELKGGTLDALDLSLGDRIELPTAELKARAR